MMNIATRMAKRKQTMVEACKRLGLSRKGVDKLHKPDPWEFLINRKFHLVWCNVFKAASTSWIYNFNILAGYTPQFLKRSNTVPVELARKKYSRPTMEELKFAQNDSITFIIVRHPLERFLSAYRDKIENALPNTPHKKLGDYIIRKYRSMTGKIKHHFRRSEHMRRPTISEFVDYAIETWQDGKKIDMHWVPMTEFCTPCQIQFDLILKFETFQDDQHFLIQLAGLNKIIKPEWKNPTKGRVTADVVYHYFSQLTVSQVLQLVNMYKFDLEIFNYSSQKYINMAKPDS